jgi:hypothetical protein
VTDDADMTERHRRMLAEFAELCLGSARDLHMRQIAAQDGAEAAALAGALHKVGRSLRQSMALEAKLKRDQEAAGREAQAAVARAEEDRKERRREQVEAVVERLIWTEAEKPDIAKSLVAELSDLLDAEILADRFGEEPQAAHVARLLDVLGVTLEEHGQAQAAFLDPAWRSSA